jgi:hypothetical protein
MNWELQIRWLWLKKTNPKWSWVALDDWHIHPNVGALFNVALGNNLRSSWKKYFMLEG